MATIDTTLDTLRNKIRELLLPFQAPDYPVTAKHRVYKGSPIPEQLDTDLRAKILHVAVIPAPSGEQRMDGKNSSAEQVSAPNVQLTATLSATKLVGAPVTVTFSGTVVEGTRTMTQIGAAYVPHRPTTGATPAQVATGVAAAINAHAEASALVTATAAAATVTVTNKNPIAVGGSLTFDFRIGGTAQYASELRRGKAEFHVHVFGYDDPSRVRYSDAIDDGLAALEFLSLQDGTTAKLEFVRSFQTDRELSHLVYRRTLVYSVQYIRTALTTGYQVLAGLVTIKEGN